MEWHITDAQSLAIIDHEIGDRLISPAEYEITRRVIYATGDFEYKSLINFSERAIQSAVAALSARTTIVVDLPMIQAGIAYEIQETFANPIFCGLERMNRPQNAQTNAAWGLETLARRYPEGIFVIGQAQTALTALMSLIETQEIKPSLIIATSPNFNDVNSNQEQLQNSLIPNITINSNKGNAVVATAILDALIDLAWQAHGKKSSGSEE
ncbi:precorrin-8X methylmutase [Calothrix sp. PCC 6303]|uniref:precorrin-8X methylmutase n=1 Tax=Calothrix sp. PCC 6303 TaxID=1170562 RepID=UPI0002A039A0|nr:precorrin-8X methylmutase [Calothrix sp. PCC 6303]AFZ02364.1 precorrin-8X methylmutase [Calothrix sp. PCC 6303]